jgi:phosphatidylserine/phosphatidylglycerophosphate/cardiolipin synthase-like enzyme
LKKGGQEGFAKERVRKAMKMTDADPVLIQPVLSKEFEFRMDRVTGTVVRDGNSVALLPSGAQSYDKRWELLERAQRSIHIVAFSMMRDDTSRRLQELLCEKLRQGVSVRMIFDDAVIYSTFAGPLLEGVVRAGGEVIRYHKLFRDIVPDLRQGHPFRQLAQIFKIKQKRRFHEKYLVVDGREAILGGINWGNKYAYGGVKPKAWRDTDVYLSGPVVADIQNQFVRDLFFYRAMDEEFEQRKNKSFNREAVYRRSEEAEQRFRQENAAELFPPLPEIGSERIRYIAHKPYDRQRLPLTDACLMLLRSARRYVYWGCHGIRPPQVIAEALVDAVRRGVEVRLITNSRRSARTLMFFGLLGWMYWESRNHYHYLLANGIRIFEWQKPGAFHSKNLVIDDGVASIGSYNVARGSAFHHTESNVVVYGGDFPAQVRQQFEIDFNDCRELSIGEARAPWAWADPYRRPLHDRNFLIDATLLPEEVRRGLNALLQESRPKKERES